MPCNSRRTTRRDRQLDQLLMRSKQARAQMGIASSKHGKSAMLNSFNLRREACSSAPVPGIRRTVDFGRHQPGSVARALIAQAERSLAEPATLRKHGCSKVLGDIQAFLEQQRTPSTPAEAKADCIDVGSFQIPIAANATTMAPKTEENDPLDEAIDVHEQDALDHSIAHAAKLEENARFEDQSPEEHPQNCEEWELTMNDEDIGDWLTVDPTSSLPCITAIETENLPTATHNEDVGQSIEAEQPNIAGSRKCRRVEEDSSDGTDQARSPAKLAKHDANDDKASSIRPGSRAAGGPSTCLHYALPEGQEKDCNCPNWADYGLDEDEMRAQPKVIWWSTEQTGDAVPAIWIDEQWVFSDATADAETQIKQPEGEEEQEDDDDFEVLVNANEKLNKLKAEFDRLVAHGTQDPETLDFETVTAVFSKLGEMKAEYDRIIADHGIQVAGIIDFDMMNAMFNILKESSAGQDQFAGDQEVPDVETTSSENRCNHHQPTSDDYTAYAGLQERSNSRSQTVESELARTSPIGSGMAKHVGKSKKQRNKQHAGHAANAPPFAPTGPASSRKASSLAHSAPNNPNKIQKRHSTGRQRSKAPATAPTAPRAMRKDDRSHVTSVDNNMRYGRQSNANRRHTNSSNMPTSNTEPEDIGFRFKGAAGSSQRTEMSSREDAVRQESEDEYARERRERDEQRMRSKTQRSKKAPAQSTGRRAQGFDEDAMDWE